MTADLKPGHGAPSASVTEDSTLTTGTCALPLPPLPEQPQTVDRSSIVSTAGSSPCGSATLPTNGDAAHHPDGRAVSRLVAESVPINSYVPMTGNVGGAPAGATPLRGSAVRLLTSLLTNHVLWGIAIGFVLSLTKVGPKRLDPGKGAVVVGGKAIYLPNPDFVEELGFIDQVSESLCFAALRSARAVCMFSTKSCPSYPYRAVLCCDVPQPTCLDFICVRRAGSGSPSSHGETPRAAVAAWISG